MAYRYPMGKGRIPEYSYWKEQKLGYIEARKKIYIPLYKKAVENTKEYTFLKSLYKKEGILNLWDYDGYDYLALNMTYKDVIKCHTRKMGHAFVLAMVLDDYNL